MCDTNERLYLAMVWRNGPDKPGERVSVLAKNLEEAERLLEEAYGKGNVFISATPMMLKKCGPFEKARGPSNTTTYFTGCPPIFAAFPARACHRNTHK
jgi:hypothetical protein